MSIIFPKDVLKIIADKLEDSDRIKHLEEVIYNITSMCDIYYVKCRVKGCHAYFIYQKGHDYYNCKSIIYCSAGHSVCDKHVICPLCPQ